MLLKDAEEQGMVVQRHNIALPPGDNLSVQRSILRTIDNVLGQ